MGESETKTKTCGFKFHPSRGSGKDLDDSGTYAKMSPMADAAVGDVRKRFGK